MVGVYSYLFQADKTFLFAQLYLFNLLEAGISSTQSCLGFPADKQPSLSKSERQFHTEMKNPWARLMHLVSSSDNLVIAIVILMEV